MRFLRLPVWRRLLSPLLVGCLLAFTVEVPIAEAHDGDASGAALTQTVPSGAVAQSLTISSHRSDSGPTPDGHGFHVCHCTHSHVGCLPSGGCPGQIEALVSTSPTFPHRQFISVTVSPILRPPIA